MLVMELVWMKVRLLDSVEKNNYDSWCKFIDKRR